MRLREVSVLGGAFLVLASAGCSKLHSGGMKEIDVKKDNTHFKSDPVTPQTKAMNEIALAQEYWQQGQYEIALEDVQKAIKIDPNSPEAYTMLGLLDEKINRLEQANAAYAKSASLAPNNGNILNNYGAWLCRSGHPAEADVQFRKALADPFYKTPAAALGNAAECALEAGHTDVAEGYYRRVLSMEPGNPNALQSMAGIDFKRGEYLPARGFIERLIAAGSVAPETLDLAAHIEDKLGDTQAAQNYRTRLGSEFPQYTPHQF